MRFVEDFGSVSVSTKASPGGRFMPPDSPAAAAATAATAATATGTTAAVTGESAAQLRPDREQQPRVGDAATATDADTARGNNKDIRSSGNGQDNEGATNDEEGDADGNSDVVGRKESQLLLFDGELNDTDALLQLENASSTCDSEFSFGSFGSFDDATQKLDTWDSPDSWTGSAAMSGGAEGHAGDSCCSIS